MQSTNLMRSLATESISYFKSNISNLLKLIIKFSLFKFIASMIFVMLNDCSANFPKINFIFWLLSSTVMCCAGFSFAILITRHVIVNEKLTEPFIKTMYSSMSFRLFAPTMLYILSAVILIGLPVAVKIFLNNTIGNGLLIVGLVGLVVIYVRFTTLATDIMINDKIRLDYNLELTREKFINTLGAFFLAICPFIVMTLVCMFLFYLISLVSSNSAISFYEFYFKNTHTISFISTIFNFVYGIITMFIYAFGYIVMSKFYSRLTQQSVLNVENSLVSSSDLNIE